MTTKPAPVNVRNIDTDRSIVRELSDLDDAGVTSSFSVIPGAKLRCAACNDVHPASLMTLLDVRRLEGKSDPSEMAAVLTLRCGHCQAEGACVVGFGPMASAEDQDVMLALDADERVTSDVSGRRLRVPPRLAGGLPEVPRPASPRAAS